MDYPISVPNVGLVGGKFTDGNPAGGVPASLDPSSWANLVTDELLNLLVPAGIAPSEAVNTQVASAIQSMQLNYGAVDTGAANAYVVAYTPAIVTLMAGMVLRFKAVNANTGASTANFGPGAYSIVGLGGQPLQGGEIKAGSIVKLLYIGASTCVLLSASGGALPVAPGTQNNHAVNLGQFLSSLSASGGYIKYPAPSGQPSPLLQGGTFNFSTAGTANTFPIAFPNALIGFGIGATGSAGTSNIVSFTTLTTTGFTAKSSASSGSYTYFSFGY